ncbi:MAG: prepilin-type cleavage/methylation domain-containing protein [Woeseiaceae bacterium]|nr:prepilin-type cleavage/methylation domain-containing protein [Woeseiaceae bacterium]
MKSRGFGLLDLMIAVVVLSLLAAVAVPSYKQFVVRAKNAKAIGDIGSISIQIDKFRLNNNQQLPAALSDLPMDIPLDPWGTPYQYLVMAGKVTSGAARKDGKLVPVNSDYDLWSYGNDGDSASPLTANVSRDDIVRANNGAFIGLGEDY